MIAAIDPGGGTGIALWNDGVFSSYEIEGRPPAVFAIKELVPQSIQIVIERFTIGQATVRKSQQQDALRLIGWTEGLCLVYDVPFYESPQSALKWGPPDALKTLGWHRPTKNGHANSAAMHLLHWLATTPRGRASGGDTLLKRLTP